MGAEGLRRYGDGLKGERDEISRGGLGVGSEGGGRNEGAPGARGEIMFGKAESEGLYTS